MRSCTTTHSPGQRLLVRPGLLLFLLGLGPGLYLSVRAFFAGTSAVFSLPTIDFVPYELSDHLRCPTLLASDETGNISITVDNPSAATIEYSARVAAGQTSGDGRSPGLLKCQPLVASVRAWHLPWPDETGKTR